MTIKTVSHFEALMRHLTLKLIVFPMTKNRRDQLKEINFQKPFAANGFLEEWFDIGLLEWPGNETISKRVVADVD